MQHQQIWVGVALPTLAQRFAVWTVVVKWWAATWYLVVRGVFLNKTIKITFCALTAALGAVIMLLAYFPYFTYAVPAITGVLTIMVMIEVDKKWAFATYTITSVLAFLFAESEAKFMYIIFFGYYPIIKAIIEKVKNRGVQYLLKFLVFNTSIVLFYAVLAKLFLMPQISDFGEFGKYSVVLFLLLGNLTFYLYDIVLVKAANLYILKIHPKIQKIRIK